MEKLYGGIDIHKESLAGCIMKEDGNIIRTHISPFSKKSIERFLLDIPNSEITFTIEACALWRGAYKILTELGYKVKLANSKKTHGIASNKKTDKVDAHILADLLRTNYLPEVWIPDVQTLKLRDLTPHKTSLTHLHVSVQQKIKGYLLCRGRKYGKLWNEKTLTPLAEEEHNIRNLISVYRCLKAEENNVKKRIENIARMKKETMLLMSINGIGALSSLIILAEIGDIHRFKSPKSLVSYTELCLGVYQSGNTERTVKKQHGK